MVVIIANVALKAEAEARACHKKDERYWIMRAESCDDTSSINYDHLTRYDFMLRDEQGKNIYQIALEKHKATGSLACAKMAVMIELYEKRIHEQLNNEIVALMEISEKLDEVEKTFEVPHKSEN